MLTFNGMYSRAQDIVGSTDATTLANIKMDINQGLRLFKNAARRYWTRQEKTTDIVASQQYYQLSEDMVRITQVKVTASGMSYPLIEIASEKKWNELNIVPAVTINVPTYYFVRGAKEIGLWPTPSVNVTGGLDISFEPRLVDMSAADVTGASGKTLGVTVNNTAVTASASLFTPQMGNGSFYLNVGDGTDGNWYKISAYVSATAVTLENYYQGITEAAAATYTIGQCPDIPEDYHLALVYYAAYNYFLKRKDMQVATLYSGMFQNLLQQYKETYSSKTTGVVVTDNSNNRAYNIFSIPPNSIS